MKVFGSVVNAGSLASRGIVPARPIVADALSADHRGYWLVAANGGVYGFGDARFSAPKPARRSSGRSWG